MTTDISKIRISLKNYEEIKLPYKFPPKCHIKYITLKDDDEIFYEGGTFVRMGNYKIILNVGGSLKYIPTCIRSDDGEVIYKSRFYISKDTPEDIMIGGGKKKTKSDKIIESQQNVIKRVSEQLKLSENRAHELQCDNYELRTELEERDREILKLKENEKKYRLLLAKFMH